MKEFEALYILKADLTPEETEKEVSAIETIATGEGGNMIEHSDWGKKRLAYAIGKQRYGQYILFRFGAPSTVPANLARHFRYNENVLKGMVVRLDGSTGYTPGCEPAGQPGFWNKPAEKPEVEAEQPQQEVEKKNGESE